MTRPVVSRLWAPLAAALLGLYLAGCPAPGAESKDAKSKAAPPPAKKAPPPPPKLLEAPQPLITWVFPAGGRRGSTFEALATGQNLVAPGSRWEDIRVTFSGAGVTGKVMDGKDPNRVRISITIAPNAELGERELRFLTPGGVSNCFRFHVGQLPEVNETEPNSTREQAQSLPGLPVLVNGQILENDRDYFRFRANAGQTLVLSVRAKAIVPYMADAVPGWFDPCLTIWDATGREAAYADDFRFTPDPVLVFRAPKDGEYLLEVRDIIYRGRGDFIYRVSIGELPHLTHIFPLGGRRGSEAPVEVRGINMPPRKIRVAVPAGAPPRFPVLVREGEFELNPVNFAAGDLPEILESEPNDAPATAQRIVPPVVVNGRIQTPGDADHFVFPAKAGERYLMEVQARRLDSPLDAVLTLFNLKGVQLAENDDWNDPLEALVTHHADPHLVFTVPANGDYVLRLKDVPGHGGEEFAYRLIVAPLAPDFALRILPDNPRVGQGGTVAITVNCLRRDGFGSDIKLSVTGLPPGFVASEAIVPNGQDQGRLTITAPQDAPLGVFSPSVIGTAEYKGQTITRRAETAEAMMQAFAYTHNVPTKQLNLAVLKPAAFHLTTELQPGVLEVAPGSETNIIVKIHREPDAKNPVTVSAARPVPAINVRSAFVAADKDEAVLVLSIAADAKVGLQQNIIISGVMKTPRETIIRYLPAIPIRVVPGNPKNAGN